MTKHGTKDWLPLLPRFLRFYNHERVHTVTGAVSADVHAPKIGEEMLKRGRGALEHFARRTRMRSNARRLPPLSVGHRVRVALARERALQLGGAVALARQRLLEQHHLVRRRLAVARAVRRAGPCERRRRDGGGPRGRRGGADSDAGPAGE